MGVVAIGADTLVIPLIVALTNFASKVGSTYGAGAPISAIGGGLLALSDLNFLVWDTPIYLETVLKSK